MVHLQAGAREESPSQKANCFSTCLTSLKAKSKAPSGCVARNKKRSRWNWVEIPIILWEWGWERAPVAVAAPCCFALESAFAAGFADEILGEGRPLASSEETDETLLAGAGRFLENGEGLNGEERSILQILITILDEVTHRKTAGT